MPNRRFRNRTRAGGQSQAPAPAKTAVMTARLARLGRKVPRRNRQPEISQIDLQAVCGSLPSGLAWSTALGSCCAKIWVI